MKTLLSFLVANGAMLRPLRYRIPPRLVWSAFFAVFFLADSAIGSTVTVLFSGTFDVSNAPLIPVGTPFAGHFTYSTTDFGGGFEFATYVLDSAADGMFVTANGFSFTAGPGATTFASVGNGPTAPFGNLDNFSIGSHTAANNTSDYPGRRPNLGLQIVGNPNFLSSNNLPAFFDEKDVILGPCRHRPHSFSFLRTAISTDLSLSWGTYLQSPRSQSPEVLDSRLWLSRC